MTGRTFGQRSIVLSPITAVWHAVTDFSGINSELMPLMRMRVPAAHRNTTVATVPVGSPLGRFWIFFFGFLPLDYDDLTITELEPNSHFQEVSTMLSMRRWEHRRELRAVTENHTEITDIVTFETRLPLPGFAVDLVERVLRMVFAHRHRKLGRRLASGGSA